MPKFQFVLFLVLALVSQGLAFVGRSDWTYGSHVKLTEKGIKRSVREYFLEKKPDSSASRSTEEGNETVSDLLRDKVKLSNDISLDKLFSFYYGFDCKADLTEYKSAVKEIVKANLRTDSDKDKYNRADYHFDGEMIEESNLKVIELREEAKKASEEDDPSKARQKIGYALHAIQDFYSHSNWVEMGKTEPNPGLGNDKGFGVPLAGKETPTCKPCSKPTGKCKDNVVVTDELTTGYYKGWSAPPETGPNGENVEKPKGVPKCSHGSGADQSAFKDPIGGINKDTGGAAHGYLHRQAADLAELSTAEFITGFRRAIGDELFEKFLALGQPQCETNRRRRSVSADRKHPKFFSGKM